MSVLAQVQLDGDALHVRADAAAGGHRGRHHARPRPAGLPAEGPILCELNLDGGPPDTQLGHDRLQLGCGVFGRLSDLLRAVLLLCAVGRADGGRTVVQGFEVGAAERILGHQVYDRDGNCDRSVLHSGDGLWAGLDVGRIDRRICVHSGAAGLHR
uniref:(northern house mosquito) hypothetical protein n=1 Tax=Culex pipiens TaxID=7175 RepID=A0A8D8FK21_CULPI